jgi:hypothetical protein
MLYIPRPFFPLIARNRNTYIVLVSALYLQNYSAMMPCPMPFIKQCLLQVNTKAEANGKCNCNCSIFQAAGKQYIA